MCIPHTATALMFNFPGPHTVMNKSDGSKLTHGLQTRPGPAPGRWCRSPGPAARPRRRSSTAGRRSRSTPWRPWYQSPPGTGSPHGSSRARPATRGSTPPVRRISVDSRSDSPTAARGGPPYPSSFSGHCVPPDAGVWELVWKWIKTISLRSIPDPPHSSSSLGDLHHVLSFVHLVSRFYLVFVINRTCKTTPTRRLFTAVPVNHSSPPMTLSLFSSNDARMNQTVYIYTHPLDWLPQRCYLWRTSGNHFLEVIHSVVVVLLRVKTRCVSVRYSPRAAVGCPPRLNSVAFVDWLHGRARTPLTRRARSRRLSTNGQSAGLWLREKICVTHKQFGQ